MEVTLISLKMQDQGIIEISHRLFLTRSQDEKTPIDALTKPANALNSSCLKLDV